MKIVINYSPSCCSKAIRPSFIFVTLRYFLLNPRDFWPCIDSNAITTFKAQKGSKHIVKIVHVTISGNFMRILFMRKENANNDFIQQCLLFHVSFQHVFTRLPRRMRAVLLTQEPALWHGTRMRCAWFASRGRGLHKHVWRFWQRGRLCPDELREMDIPRQNGGSCAGSTTCVSRDSCDRASKTDT